MISKVGYVGYAVIGKISVDMATRVMTVVIGFM